MKQPSELEIYLFEKEYPRTNGFVRFNPGSSISTISTSGSANNHRNPTVKEYIFLKGGPNIDNIWNTASYRSSNLEINGNKGNTVEFWLKKDGWAKTSGLQTEILFHNHATGAAESAANGDYGSLRIDFDGDMTATNTTIASNSDERLKENIQDYSGGLDIITKLRPVTFEYKDSKFRAS